MQVFEIQGENTLSGEIEVRGSKNAAAALIPATLLTTEPCVLSNVPLIEDIFRLLDILKSMGSEVEWLQERKVKITNKAIDPEKIDFALVKKIRMSILLLGALSARFEKFRLYHPGGCVIGARPVDAHMDALSKLGVTIEKNDSVYEVDASKKHGAEIVLREFSVTATENAMMLAASLPGKSIIKIAAAEPHVEDLGVLLQSMGAKISGLGTHTLEIEGNAHLSGAEHEIIPDPIEAATFLILGMATKSPLKVRNARPEHLDLVLEKLREFGADFVFGDGFIQVLPPERIVSPGKVKVELYPGIPTDTQSLFGVLAAVAEGDTLIHDHMFEGRFNYLMGLEKMNVRSTALNPHQALIHGTGKLKGTMIRSYDLRAGASLIIAALAASGTTIIEEIEQVDRGYEKIEERLQRIGAQIVRKEISE
ncbi:MAG: UDP-N-acetylglucosamine 1-carboxyvinyltransferase [Candidatus Moranbacteria bacterium]|nr:UDP-N-acetylglucosamine 1-carboxyvinyltransferase [Candidatus Moranbacteria bacterium]